MKRTRIFALLLALLMLVGLVSACGGGDEGGGGDGTTTTPKKSEGGDTPDSTGSGGSGENLGDVPPEDLDWITLSMFVAAPGTPPSSGNEIVKTIEEETKVKIEFEFVVGDMDSRVGTMIAAGNYPDLIGPGQARARYMGAEALIPLQDELPKYARLHEHFSPYYDDMRASSTDDNMYIMAIWGRNYGPAIETFYNGPAFWIQKDVLAWGGYEIPETPDEFFDLLEKYYTEHPQIDGQNTAPFEILSYDFYAFCLFNAPQHLMGGPNDGDVFVDQNTMTASLYQNTDTAKRYYQKLNEVYKKGMISPETFTQSRDEYLTKISSGRILAMFDQQWAFADGENILMGEEKYERTYVPIGLTYDGIPQWYKYTPKFIASNGMGISVNCKDVHRSLLFMDTLLRDDLTLLATWGMEGRDYNVVDGRLRRNEEQRINWDNPQWVIDNAATKLTEQFPKKEGWFQDGFEYAGNAVSPGDQPEEILENQNAYDKEFYPKFSRDGQSFATKADFLTVPRPTPQYFPVWEFNFPDDSPEKEANVDLQETQRRHLPRVIMADDFEAEWETYMTALDGLKNRTDVYLESINRIIAEKEGIER